MLLNATRNSGGDSALSPESVIARSVHHFQKALARSPFFVLTYVLICPYILFVLTYVLVCTYRSFHHFQNALARSQATVRQHVQVCVLVGPYICPYIPYICPYMSHVTS